MNSPNMRSEQLTPKMSPIALCLDDPNNSSAFQTLLSSPTKLKLDGSSGFYTTSLSKLNDYTRSGRSRERRNSETFRSISPIRFNMATSNNNTNPSGPKMLKSEYLTQKKTNLPLLSTLLQSASATTINKTAKSSTSGIADNSKSIRETLEQIQQQQKNFQKLQSKNEKKANEADCAVQTETEQEVAVAMTTSTSSGTASDKLGPSNARSSSVVSGGSTLGNESTEILVRKRPERTKMADLNKDRVASTASSAIPLRQQPPASPADYQQVNVDNFPTDNNGFVDLNSHQKFARNPSNFGPNSAVASSPNLNNKQSNRFSFMSSTSTDYEYLFDQQAVPTIHSAQTAPNHHHHNHPTSQSNIDHHFISSQSSVSNSNSNLLSAQEIETSKLDLKIKYLEIEIQELRLQNERLIDSMNNNRSTEDQLLMELLRQKTNNSESNSVVESVSENGSVVNKKTRSMEKKVKLLEKQFDSYKKVLEKLSYIDQTVPIEDSVSLQTKSVLRRPRKTKRSSLRIPKVSRISRISSKDLRRIEENSDYSSLLISSKDNISSNEEEIIDVYSEAEFENSDIDEGDAAEYEADDENDCSIMTGSIRVEKRNAKRGLQLPMQIQK